MNDRLTINRKFHVATKRSGTKQIQSGAKPVIPAGRVPRISRLLALAHHCFRLVQSKAIINQSELAHFGQISTTRMTQIMWLDNLAPDIQEEILFLPKTTKCRTFPDESSNEVSGVMRQLVYRLKAKRRYIRAGNGASPRLGFRGGFVAWCDHA